MAKINKAKIFIAKIHKPLTFKNEIIMIKLYVISYNPLMYYAIIVIKL